MDLNRTNSAIRVLARHWLVIALAITVAACSEVEEGTGPDVSGIPYRVVVSPKRVVHPFSLDTVRLTAQAFDALGALLADQALTWTSSDPSVAAVDAAGLVSTQRFGRVTIEARAGDARGHAEVVVNPGTPLENECMRCHVSSNPYRHVAWGFSGTACTACHLMDAIPHSQKVNAHDAVSAGFVLSGAHAVAACTACHEPGSGALTTSPASDQDCVACHLTDYEGFHLDGWPTVCAACHSTVTWSGATIDHELASGGFRLLGAHSSLDCSRCHDSDTFVPRWNPGDDSDCLTCHQVLYDAQHGVSGYPTSCLTCHTTTTWLGATFDHLSASGFALPTGHADLVCSRCHDANTFAPLFDPQGSDDCIACHQGLYDAQHGADGYPPTCRTCHTTASWLPANFNHDANWFPIFSGRHDNRWADCSTCHSNPADFTDFTCFSCHAHNQTSMDNQHSGVSGYSYASAQCYSCHPSGEAP